MVGISSKVSMATILLILVALLPYSLSSKEEDKLVGKLLANYQKYGRPGNTTTALKVEHGFSLQKIVNLDRSRLTATVDVWENYQWTDDRFTWDEKSYGGVNSIRLPPDAIWTPDVQLYAGWVWKQDRTNIVIYSSGVASWVPRYIYNIPCEFNKTVAHCTMKVGSWTYDGNKLNLTSRNDNIDTSYYIPTANELLRTYVIRSVKNYECCPEPYIDITYHIVVNITGNA